jgi:hypothetical protein
MKKPRYTGKLGRPIIKTPAPRLEGAVTRKRLAQFKHACRQHRQDTDLQQQKEEAEKINLLMKLFGVPSNNFKKLALELARAHVPGFRIEVRARVSARGRTRKWDGPMLLELIKVVDEVKGKHTRFNDRLALKHIATRLPYKERWGAPANHKGKPSQWIETLESRLQEAKTHRRFIEGLPDLLNDLQKKFRKL